MKYESRAHQIFNYFNIVFLIIVCSTCVLPFLNLLAISFSAPYAVSANMVRFWPIDFTLGAYEFAFKGSGFLSALWISVQRVVLGVTVNLTLMVLTAYPLSMPKEKLMGRNIYMIYFVITMILNGGLIPTYLTVTKLGLLNSLWALVLPGALPVFSMIILMNFIRGLPDELQEAAAIDGASPMVILLRIMLPLLLPSLATVGLFSIVAHWNDWFAGLIYMQNNQRYPLQTYLQTLLWNFERMLRMVGASGDFSEMVRRLNVRTGRAAQLFLAMVPIMMIYPFLQKYFTTGLVIGSVKG